jgi:hypothetical protein
MPRLSLSPARHGSQTRPIAIALFLMFAISQTGCMSWKMENVAPVQTLKTPVPARLRVTLVNGEARYLDSARVEGDSLIGNALATKGRWARDHTGAQVHIAAEPAGRTAFLLSDVARTDAKRASTGKSVALAIPVVGLAGLMVLFAVASGLE